MLEPWALQVNLTTASFSVWQLAVTVGVETCWPEGLFWWWHLVDPNDTNQSWKVRSWPAPWVSNRRSYPSLVRTLYLHARSPSSPFRTKLAGPETAAGWSPLLRPLTQPTLPSLGLGTVTVEHHKGSPSAPQQTPLKVVRLRERPPSQMYTCSDPRNSAHQTDWSDNL